MSYSISNVLAEAGLPNILRWVPFDVSERDLRNRIKNKMIRPTTIPSTLEELMIEQAISREALRLAFIQHKSLAVGLKGVQQERTISDTFEQTASGETIVNLESLRLMVGSGGVLSHAPRRVQSALMMIDAFLPEGVTELAVDSIFMAPQLGVLSTREPAIAKEVFEKDCLIRLGTVIAPWGTGKEGGPCFSVELRAGGKKETRAITFGEMAVFPLAVGETAEATITPDKGFDVGMGRGKSMEAKITGGVVGLVLDGRGRRPFVLPADPAKRIGALARWNEALTMYPRPGVAMKREAETVGSAR
jgi:hypothetical protein